MSPIQREGELFNNGAPPRSPAMTPPHSVPLLAQIRTTQKVLTLGPRIYLKLPEQVTGAGASTQASYLALLTDPTYAQEMGIIATRNTAWDTFDSTFFPNMDRFSLNASRRDEFMLCSFLFRPSLSRTSTKFLVLATRGSPHRTTVWLDLLAKWTKNLQHCKVSARVAGPAVVLHAWTANPTTSSGVSSPEAAASSMRSGCGTTMMAPAKSAQTAHCCLFYQGLRYGHLAQVSKKNLCM